MARRNLTKGQMAIGFAMIYPDPEKGGRGKKAVETTGFSRERLSKARAIVAYSEKYELKLAEAVRDGSKQFDEAYVTVTAFLEGIGKLITGLTS